MVSWEVAVSRHRGLETGQHLRKWGEEQDWNASAEKGQSWMPPGTSQRGCFVERMLEPEG